MFGACEVEASAWCRCISVVKRGYARWKVGFFFEKFSGGPAGSGGGRGLCERAGVFGVKAWR